MNMSELCNEVAAECELPKDVAKKVVETVFGLIVENLKTGNRVNLRNFGSFVVVSSGPRKTRNPRTGESIQIEGKKRPKFKVSASLKKMIAE
jgi:nucleoid DNA-binding protein